MDAETLRRGSLAIWNYLSAPRHRRSYGRSQPQESAHDEKAVRRGVIGECGFGDDNVGECEWGRRDKTRGGAETEVLEGDD